MHDLPQSHDLLETARDSLLNELLPHLPAAQKYTALMIANAIAIANREQSLAATTLHARRQLQRQVPSCTEIFTSDLKARDQQFCTDLRSGALDAELLALLPALRADVVSRLQVGNPKYLQQLQQLAAEKAGGAVCAS